MTREPAAVGAVRNGNDAASRPVPLHRGRRWTRPDHRPQPGHRAQAAHAKHNQGDAGLNLWDALGHLPQDWVTGCPSAGVSSEAN